MHNPALHGRMHHHNMHEFAVSAAKVLHQPSFWLAVGMLVMLAVVIALTLAYGEPPQPPAGWDGYMWMPY